jgi:hypothetical protein
MTIKEKIKKDIDQLPNELIEQVQKYLNSIKPTPQKKKTIHTFHLKGEYDNINIRQKAYE